MSAMEINNTVAREGQKDSPPVLTDNLAPFNFAEVTPSQFGISVQSFSSACLSPSNRKDKSRLAQIKARRRSNVGARGSPETNSLIRFIAQQRMNTPQDQHTPQLVGSSLFLPKVSSTLRQKMVSFQSLMGMEEESEGDDVMSKQDGSTGGCIETRDYLSGGKNREARKENHPPSMRPSKKRRLGLSQGCKEEEASVKQKPLLSSDTGEAAQVLVISPTEKQQEAVFELQSLDQPTPDDPAGASPTRPASHFQIPSIFSLLEMKPTADSMASPVLKKKQVRFGEPLSPELFDKELPPSTPLQRGGTPAPTPGGSLKTYSLLKTPQRVTPQPQRGHHGSSMFGASPTQSIPRIFRMVSTEEDRSEIDGKIPFSLEEIEREVDNTADYILNLDNAFDEESLSQIETESETKAPETTSTMDILPPEPLKEKENQPQTNREAPASGRSSKRRKVTHDANEAPARSSSQKRKLPEENEPVKRLTRSAAKMAAGKMKTSTAKRQWNKKVDNTLYGCRVYASKNPSLSPIRERLLFSQSSEAEESLSDTCTAPSQEPLPDLRCNGKSVSADPTTEVGNNTSETGDTALNASTTPEDAVSFPMSRRRSGTRKNRRLSGPKVRGKALKGEKVGVVIGQAGSKLHDKFEKNTSDECENKTNQKESEGGQSKQTRLECHEVVNEKLCAANSLHTPSIGLEEESESPAILDSPTSASLPAGEKFKHTTSLSAQGEAEQSQEGQPEDDKMNHEVEKKQGDQTVSQQKNNQSGSVSHKEETAAQLVLLPWQADFNFEDVFKPVAPRRQHSVRRSLRNKTNTDQSNAGLVWLPHTSPESIRESRRRTRILRLSGVMAALAPEVTQP